MISPAADCAVDWSNEKAWRIDCGGLNFLRLAATVSVFSSGVESSRYRNVARMACANHFRYVAANRFLTRS